MRSLGPSSVVTPVGLEPTTSRLEVSRSIQLSYGADAFHYNIIAEASIG